MSRWKDAGSVRTVIGRLIKGYDRAAYFLTQQAAPQAALATSQRTDRKKILTVPRIGQDAKDLDANLTQRGEGDDRLKLNADDVLREVL
jgi:hypothetical protein